jgi:hypothetical protein
LGSAAGFLNWAMMSFSMVCFYEKFRETETVGGIEETANRQPPPPPVLQ